MNDEELGEVVRDNNSVEVESWVDEDEEEKVPDSFLIKSKSKIPQVKNTFQVLDDPFGQKLI